LESYKEKATKNSSSIKAEECLGLPLTREDRVRYDRQILIHGFGEAGQKKLKRSSVLVVGAGGLGCAAAAYLIVAGIQNLTIIDCDKVELSNLNRQILHWQSDIGKYKANSAAEKLRQMNPTVNITSYHNKATCQTFRQVVKNYDVALDCLDNWPTRFALNKACVEAGVPMVHAGVRGFGGQVTTIKPRQGPCLRCIFPKTPKAERWPVLGAAPGMFGCLQAIETIKLITGIGEPLIGRLLVYDGEAANFYMIKVKRSRTCSNCGRRK